MGRKSEFWKWGSICDLIILSRWTSWTRELVIRICSNGAISSFLNIKPRCILIWSKIKVWGKINLEFIDVFRTAVKSIKSKGGHVEHQVSAVVTTSQRKVPAPVVKAVQKQNAPVSTKTVTVTSPKTEILENKSKAVKKPKESASKPTTSSVTQQKEIKPGQAAPKVKKEKMQLQKIDIWADEEINYEAWQAVPMKSVKATAAAGSKSTNKNSSTATGKSAASKKQPPESAPEKDKEKEKKSQANQKLEVCIFWIYFYFSLVNILFVRLNLAQRCFKFSTECIRTVLQFSFHIRFQKTFDKFHIKTIHWSFCVNCTRGSCSF